MDGWLGVKAVLMIAYCNQKRLIQVDVNKYLVEVFLTQAYVNLTGDGSDMKNFCKYSI